MCLTKKDYAKIICDTLELAGATLLNKGNMSQISCALNGKIYRFYVRYRHFPKNESKLAHFEETAFEKLLNKAKADEIPCLAYLGRYEVNGKDQITVFGMEIEKILSLEKGASNLFSIGEKTKRHIVKQPITIADELELIKESIIFSKIILPIPQEKIEEEVEGVVEADFEDIYDMMHPNME